MDSSCPPLPRVIAGGHESSIVLRIANEPPKALRMRRNECRKAKGTVLVCRPLWSAFFYPQVEKNAMSSQESGSQPPVISRGDSIRHKPSKRTGVAMTDGTTGTVMVKQDDLAITSWSVWDCEKIAGAK